MRKGFFEIKPLNETDIGFAKELKKILSRDSNLQRNANTRQWAKEFQLLRQTEPEPEIKSALEYLNTNLKAERIPLIRSAKTFRLKYQSLKQHQQIATGKTTTTQKPITDCAVRIRNQMGFLWPNTETGTRLEIHHEDSLTERVAVPEEPGCFLSRIRSWEQLDKSVGYTIETCPDLELRTIQISLDNYREFLTRLRNQESQEQDRHLKNLIGFVLRELPDPFTFTRDWMRYLHQLASEWENWDGCLIDRSFHWNRKRFRKQITYLSLEYLGHEHTPAELIGEHETIPRRALASAGR